MGGAEGAIGGGECERERGRVWEGEGGGFGRGSRGNLGRGGKYGRGTLEGS